MTAFDDSRNVEFEAILAGDLEPQIPISVREALLDVVLAWANLDMATAFFLASVSGLDPDEGAKRFGRKEIAEKLKRAAKTLKEDDQAELSDRVNETANQYQDMSLYRRRIAHSKCAGVRKSNPERIIFLPFEQEGPKGHLAMEVFHIDCFKDAITWARKEHDFYLRYVDDYSFFEPR